jgi:hypothetical protein
MWKRMRLKEVRLDNRFTSHRLVEKTFRSTVPVNELQCSIQDIGQVFKKLKNMECMVVDIEVTNRHVNECSYRLVMITTLL